MTATASPTAAPRDIPRSRWDRTLAQYPPTRQRMACLGIVVLATIVMYYQFYLVGALATRIISDYHMSFVYFVNITVAAAVLGAVASFFGGISDRYGRTNIVSAGLFIVALLCLIGIPNADSKLGFGILYAAVGFVEGVVLVATPALIRDFSPQVGRASAMAFWTLGPASGTLVCSIAVSNTSDTADWQNQFVAAGVAGLVVAGLAALFLRELAPELRDQLMVSSRDQALIEARAAGTDVEAALKHPFRQILKVDVVVPAMAISLFMIMYFLMVGFFPVYYQTIFSFSQSTANALGNWTWGSGVVALIVVGYVSDKLRVRKPFMLVGAISTIILSILFLSRATHPDTSYSTLAWLVVGLSCSIAATYAPWMASYTETVERHNPALTATGLAVWGLTIRSIIAVSVFFVPHVVTTVTTLVEQGGAVQAGAVPGFTAAENTTVKDVAADPAIVPKVQSLAAKYASQLATATKIDPATQAALATDPTDEAAAVKALSEISGVSAPDVATIMTLNAQHGPALAAAKAIDPTTQVGLLRNPNDTTTLQKAVGEVVAKLGVSQEQAIALLTELKSILVPQLVTMQTSGEKVLTAGAGLTALSTVPAVDLAFVGKYGPSLSEPKVQKILTDVKKAAEDSPKQWQTYFWVAVAGQFIFIPLIFLMVGFWDPRKARRKEEEHQAWVDAELAKLASSESPA